MTERPVPLMKIGEYTSMRIAQPPPYRDRLAVRLETLNRALTTAGINDYDINIRFTPVTTRVDLHPSGNWQFVPSYHDEGETDMIVTMNDLCVFTWVLPYRDEEISSAYATARLASVYFRRAIVQSPRVLQSGERFGERVRQIGIPTVRAYFDQFFHHDIVVEE